MQPAVDALSRPNGFRTDTGVAGSTAGGTSLTISGGGWVDPQGEERGLYVTIDGVQCATEESEVGEYRHRNLCEWGDIQRQQGKGDMAVDCAHLQRNSTHVTCITNPFAFQGNTPKPNAVDVIVDGLGRARNAPNTSYTYTDLWSAKTTWGGDAPPRAGDSVVVTTRQFIVLDVSPPPLVLVVLMGTLSFDDSDTTGDLEFSASYIMVHNGRLQVGTESKMALIRSALQHSVLNGQSSALGML